MTSMNEYEIKSLKMVLMMKSIDFILTNLNKTQINKKSHSFKIIANMGAEILAILRTLKK